MTWESVMRLTRGECADNLEECANNKEGECSSCAFHIIDKDGEDVCALETVNRWLFDNKLISVWVLGQYVDMTVEEAEYLKAQLERKLEEIKKESK